MKIINEIVEKEYGNYEEKIIQFGEGNFLRAFIDYMINLANQDGIYRGSIVVCQPIENGMIDLINYQDSIYTLVMRGIENDEKKEVIETITSISRCINPYKDFNKLLEMAKRKELEVFLSNTTESGIEYNENDKFSDIPPSSFPAKVTLFLYERYKAFNGDKDKGLLFLPFELIDNNGIELKRIILQYSDNWGLEKGFIDWVKNHNKFTNTLVDRIVTGYPKDELSYFDKRLGYKDNVIVTSELFNFLAIEGKKEWADILPIHKTKANVIWTSDIKPYKDRKVRILNGAHTSFALSGYLAGYNIVLDLMNDNIFRNFVNKIIQEEIIPTLDLEKYELINFANDVIERFSNPYIKHNLLDIALNSCSKFNTRCLPSLLKFIELNNKTPKLLTFSLASLIRFYKCKRIDGYYIGKRLEDEYILRDNKEVLEFFTDIWENDDLETITKKVLSKENFWSGKDLTKYNYLEENVLLYLKELEIKDITDIIKTLI